MECFYAVFKKLIHYFSFGEMMLWCFSAALIVLWVLASMENTKYISVVVCFAAFTVNDIYGFINWQKMKARQTGGR